MLSLHTNVASLSAQSALDATSKSLSASLSRLSTGYRVNSAMDDAAGLQIATRLDAQTRGMAVAQRNTQNGISMMQTAEGAFGEVTSILQRMKDLATQAADGSSTAKDQTAMQSEYDALGKEMGNIMKNTSFGGAQLFSNGTTVDGSLGMFSNATLTFQIGASAGETMAVDTSTQLTAAATALTAAAGTYATPATPGTEMTTGNATITLLNTAIDAIGSMRSVLGASGNRLDHVYNNLANMSQNTAAAKGRIMDVNYATETANMSSNQMLMQAGTSMIKQSNSMSQLALSLMQ
jgi:flagellin